MVKAFHLFFKELSCALSKAFNVHGILFRAIRNADAAAEIDEADSHALFISDFISQIKHHGNRAKKPRQFQFCRNHHGMDANVGNALFLSPVHAGHELFFSHAVLCFFRLADDGIAPCQFRPRIITEADFFRNNMKPIQVIQIGYIIQIDNGSQFIGFDKFFIRRIIGRKYDFFSSDAHGFGKYQLCHGAAVRAYV